jgi:hypothetical protein
MSETDIEQPRDAATGQFAPHGVVTTSSDDVSFGLQSIEDGLGYVANTPNAHLDDDLADEKIALDSLYPADSDEPVRDGVTELSTIPATYVNRTNGKELPGNVTLKEEEAGNNLAAYENELLTYVEGADLSELADAVDVARLEVLRNDPELAEKEYGLKAAEVENNANRLVEDKGQEIKAEPAKPRAEDVDAEMARAIENPRIRQFLEDNLTQAETARQQYVSGLETANQIGLARLTDLIPDVAALPVHQREDALALLAKTDPQRFSAALHEMNRITTIQNAAAQQNQHTAARAQAEFNQWAKAEDAKVGDISAADGKAVQDYLPVIGLDRDSYVRLLASDKMARSSIGQRTILDAARYHAIKNAPKAVAVRDRQSVQKPGISGRASAKEESMAQLWSNLNRSGSESDGWALLQAKMRG